MTRLRWERRRAAVLGSARLLYAVAGRAKVAVPHGDLWRGIWRRRCPLAIRYSPEGAVIRRLLPLQRHL